MLEVNKENFICIRFRISEKSAKFALNEVYSYTFI